MNNLRVLYSFSLTFSGTKVIFADYKWLNTAVKEWGGVQMIQENV